MRNLFGVNFFVHQRGASGNARVQSGRRCLKSRVKVAHFTVLNARGFLQLAGALRLLKLRVFAVHFRLARFNGVQIFFLKLPLRREFSILILQARELRFNGVKTLSAVGIFFQLQRLAFNFKTHDVAANHIKHRGHGIIFNTKAACGFVN